METNKGFVAIADHANDQIALNTIKADLKKIGKIENYVDILKIYNSCNLQEIFIKKNYIEFQVIFINLSEIYLIFFPVNTLF
jgi:hypothetical protein